MIDNIDFSSLTQFVHDEHSKIVQVYGLKSMPTKDIKIITKAVSKKFARYNMLDKKEDKLRIKINYAIFTMPHGLLWKFFHKKLWKYVQRELNKEKEQSIEDKEEAETMLPVQVVSPVDIEAMQVVTTDLE